MKHQQSGLTLIEVMIGVVLVLVMATMVMGMIPMAVTGKKTEVDQSITAAAKQYMETIPAQWSTQAAFDAGTLAATTGISSTFTCTTTVTDPDNRVAPAKALRKRVTLQCTRSNQPTVTLTTEFGRPQ